MKLSDLETGMHVICKNGDEYVLIKNVTTHTSGQVKIVSAPMIAINDTGWMDLMDYTEDLKDLDDEEFDIQEIYMPRYYRCVITPIYARPEDFELVWRRPVKKQMTLKEIEEALGYGVEIVE